MCNVTRGKITVPELESAMSVLGSGQIGVLEQLGEKQDFEAELSRRGYRHEEFTLHVEQDRRYASQAGWNPRYEVKVTHAPTQTVRSYAGGTRQDWLARFRKDLTGGLYGEPTLPRPAADSTQKRQRRV
jgi:hypothetical protein